MTASRTPLLLALGLLVGATANAGSLTSPAAPGSAGSAMYSLEDIYNRLQSGAAGTGDRASFVEPTAGPTGTGHTLTEVMDKAPEVDDTNGAAPSDVLSDKTYWSLRSDGTWGPQTGTRSPAPVPRTGQTDYSDEPGDDGDLQKGVAWPDPRFTDNNNGTVTDNLTGLIWVKDLNCVSTAYFRWYVILPSIADDVEDGRCGLTDGSSAGDWRMPNLRELYSLIDFGQGSSHPALPAGHPFVLYTGYWRFWTSTSYAYAKEDNAWIVDFYDGTTSWELKDQVSDITAWPVRGGP